MTFITDSLRPSLGGIEERLEAITTSTRPSIVTARRAVLALLFFLVIQTWAHLSITEIVNGLSLGGLYGIIGVALVLTYRTSRIINFAAAAVGAVPAIVACLLSTSEHINYLIVAPIAIIGGLAFGALTDIFVLRRFAHASRLIVTVVTIGIAQSYAALGFFIPVWFGDRATGVPKVTTPWQNLAYHNSRGEPVLTGNVLAGLIVVIALTAFLAVFLKRSRLGIALRASSESAERAALLGIPVARVQTIAWAFAGLLSALAIFTQAPLIGVPSDATLGFDTLLYGLAAAVVAKMENVSVALVTGLGIGLLISTSVLQTGTNDYASALMLPLILVGLLLQRRSRSRAVESGASTWQTVSAFRPTPIELRALPEVLRLRAVFILGGLGLTIALPYLVSAPNMPALTILPIFGIIGVSLVVLTGWAGQISLGQFGLVGMAAAVSGGLVAKHNIDFFAAIAIGIAVGAVAAMVIGLPAVRIQGLYLAVTTLAFGYAMQNYVLNINYWPGQHLLPTGYTASIVRPYLYGRFNLEDDKTFYFVCCIFLLLCLLTAASFRRQHSGRILIALRDNQRAASSYSVAPVRTRLAAFAISGAYAGVAGVLFIYLQHNVIAGSYDVFSSVGVFLAASIGGLGSLVGGTLGVIAFEASVLFGPDLWHRLGNTFDSVMPLLLTGPLLILNLYFNPGGLAGWVFGERDKWLRRIANRRKLHVPSLVADSLVAEPMPEPEL